MLHNNYIAPEVTMFHFTVEQGFGHSDQPGVNLGIDGWKDNEDNYTGDAE